MVKRVALAAAAAATVATVWAGTAVGVSGSQRFSISGTSSGRHNSGIVYASGPISGTGQDKAFGQTSDKFTFPGGSVWVSHHATSQSGSIDPRSCAGKISETGTYQLVSGTGKYKGVTGSGTYTLSGTQQMTRTPSGCSGAGTARYFVNATGWTSLP
jgi:hypothetical protein